MNFKKISNLNKKIILILSDLFIIVFSVNISFSLRLEQIYPFWKIDYKVYFIFFVVIILTFYFSNIYFSKLSDKYRSVYGIETEVKLPMSLSLIINLGQVYYDKNLLTNDIDKMTNSDISIKYSF